MTAGGAGGACWACANNAADARRLMEVAVRTIALRILRTSLGLFSNADIELSMPTVNNIIHAAPPATDQASGATHHKHVDADTMPANCREIFTSAWH